MYNSNEAVKENWGQFVYCTCTCVSLLLESSTSLLLGNWSDNNLGHKLYRFMTVIYLWANDKSKEKRRVWIQWKITIFHICDFLNKWNLKFTGEKKIPEHLLMLRFIPTVASHQIIQSFIHFVKPVTHGHSISFSFLLDSNRGIHQAFCSQRLKYPMNHYITFKVCPSHRNKLSNITPGKGMGKP